MENSSGKKIVVQSGSKQEEIPRDVLIVTSKLKAYVKAKHDMNTAGNVPERLSDKLRSLIDEACMRAKSEGRKTLMDRDF
jgi:histone H3/H4